MLGHDDVAKEVEPVLCSDLFKDGFEGDPGLVPVEEWETSVAAEGDEVIMTFGLVTLQTARHGFNVQVFRDSWYDSSGRSVGCEGDR